MTQNLERAIEVMRALPPERQDDLARAVMLYAGEEAGEVYKLTEDDKVAIAASRAQAARGEFASDEQLAAHRAKYRL